MKAIVLLGGLGTRLRPLTVHRPKPLLPILNRPFITYQLDLLKKYGVRDVVLALGHKAAHFRRALGDGRRWGVRFAYSLEKEPLGTGGAIRHALPHLRGPAFVLNGDVMSDFDLGRLARQHHRVRADATLALVRVSNPSAFGLVDTGPDGWIRRFVEKPSGEDLADKTVNAGCYLFEPGVVERIPAGRAVSIEREIFPALLAEGRRLAGFLHQGYWSDIGTLKTYWRTHADLHALQRWPEGSRVRDGWVLAEGAAVAVDVRPAGTVVVGQGSVVEPGAVLEGCVTLGAGVRVGAGARVADSVVLDGARIGPRAWVERCIVGARAVLDPDARAGPDQVLGDRARLTAFSRLERGLTEL